MGEALSRATFPSQSAHRRPPMNQAVFRASNSENMIRSGVLRSLGLLHVSVTPGHADLGPLASPEGCQPDRKNERPGPRYFQGALDSTDISSNNVKERRKPLCYLCLLRDNGSSEELGENSDARYCKRN